MARAQRNATELQSLLHISRNSVYRRMNGEIPFDLSEIHTIANWLELRVEAFYLEPERAPSSVLGASAA